jgi:hypothetical protein
MPIQLLYFDGCPNWQLTDERLREALGRIGRDDRVEYWRVQTPEEADATGFHGSPTLLVNGRDPFPAAGNVGLACRVYPTPDGPAGAPTVEQLVEVVK